MFTQRKVKMTPREQFIFHIKKGNYSQINKLMKREGIDISQFKEEAISEALLLSVRDAGKSLQFLKLFSPNATNEQLRATFELITNYINSQMQAQTPSTAKAFCKALFSIYSHVIEPPVPSNSRSSTFLIAEEFDRLAKIEPEALEENHEKFVHIQNPQENFVHVQNPVPVPFEVIENEGEQTPTKEEAPNRSCRIM